MSQAQLSTLPHYTLLYTHTQISRYDGLDESFFPGFVLNVRVHIVYTWRLSVFTPVRREMSGELALRL